MFSRVSFAARAGLVAIAGLVSLTSFVLADAVILPFGTAVKPTPSARLVTITLRDNFYEPESVKIKAGETVRFILVNQGQLLHEFALGRPGDHAKHQEMMTMMVQHGMITATGINQKAMQMNHAAMGMAAHAHGPETGSVLIEPGKRAELTWKFTRSMTLEFACTIPGHYEAGMVGKFEFAP
jgi:uncharacterized cupredoxin-like copper-binding protein